jgi:hypothetical protein
LARFRLGGRALPVRPQHQAAECDERDEAQSLAPRQGRSIVRRDGRDAALLIERAGGWIFIYCRRFRMWAASLCSTHSRCAARQTRDAWARRSRRLVDAYWIEAFVEDAENLRTLAQAQFPPDRMDNDELAAHVFRHEPLGSIGGDEENRRNLAIALEMSIGFEFWL